MATKLLGDYSWNLDINDEGHRTYTLKQKVHATSKDDGPATVFFTAGLPQVGSIWNYGNDFDSWAFCSPRMRIEPLDHKDGDPVQLWGVTNYFTTIPFKRCQDNQIDDPLLEPDRISGGFVKYTQEEAFDKDGNPIINAGYEFIKGPQVEFDRNRPTVRIEQNVVNLELNVFSQMIDRVNGDPLWGLPARTIKLSNISWERLIYGTCGYYYVRIFDFDVNYDTFDRTVLDEGRRIIAGEWETETDSNGNEVIKTPPNWIPYGWADPTNPKHFVEFKDLNGDPSSLIYDSNETGSIWDGTYLPSTVEVKRYKEANFLTLGIPAVMPPT